MYKNKIIQILSLSFAITTFCGCPDSLYFAITAVRGCPNQEKSTTTTTCYTDWTVMFYAAADKNGLQNYIEEDIAEMVAGTNNKMRIVCLLDTQSDGVRMFLITKNNQQQIYGGDIFPEINAESPAFLNTADAETLAKFIKFCKTTYPAEKYALVIGSHGNGIYEDSRGENAPTTKNYAFAKDGTSKDWIYNSELTSVYDSEEHIDLFVLDLCNMAFIEIAYQYRVGNGSFNADYIVASLPEQRDVGLPYDKIFSNVTAKMTCLDFGKLIIKQKMDFDQKYQWRTTRTDFQAMALIDTSKVDKAKKSIDLVAQKLTEKKDVYRKVVSQCNEYYLSSLKKAQIDAWQLFDKLSACLDLSDDVKTLCSTARNNLAECVIDSYICGTSPSYTEREFTSGQNGLTIFAPTTFSEWNAARSYNATDSKTNLGTDSPGQLAWCQDATSDGVVSNWFELLDYYFDTTNDYNGYKY